MINLIELNYIALHFGWIPILTTSCLSRFTHVCSCIQSKTGGPVPYRRNEKSRKWSQLWDTTRVTMVELPMGANRFQNTRVFMLYLHPCNLHTCVSFKKSVNFFILHGSILLNSQCLTYLKFHFHCPKRLR